MQATNLVPTSKPTHKPTRKPTPRPGSTHPSVREDYSASIRAVGSSNEWDQPLMIDSNEWDQPFIIDL